MEKEENQTLPQHQSQWMQMCPCPINVLNTNFLMCISNKKKNRLPVSLDNFSIVYLKSTY